MIRSAGGGSDDHEEDLGFSFTERKSGEIVISRDGRPVTTLRGAASDRFRRRVERLGDQQAMARATGNHRRGNERTGPRPIRPAEGHPVARRPRA
jgi:hypothetical protein